MSKAKTGDKSLPELPDPDSTLVCEVSCMCGFSETVEEPENGQSHGGTAGDVGARHTCKYERGEVKVPQGTQTMRFNWVFR